jgi:hypothetical protein
MNTDTFAIVGRGLAAAKTAECFRADGYAGRIVLLGAGESYDQLPYFFTDSTTWASSTSATSVPTGTTRSSSVETSPGRCSPRSGSTWPGAGRDARQRLGRHRPIRRILATGRVPVSERRDSSVALEKLTS